METICPDCGHSFSGDQCWDCLNRKEDILETSKFSLPVVGAGFVAGIISPYVYAPLTWNSVVVYLPLAMLLITLFLTIFSEPMVRYASVIRLVLVLAAVASITPEAYYFLNGMLDGRDPVAVWTVISDKEEVNNGSGIIDLLDCRLSWHQKTLDESFAVSWTVFSAAEKGNSIRVLIHPGAFSQPWYSDVQVENSRAGNSR